MLKNTRANEYDLVSVECSASCGAMTPARAASLVKTGARRGVLCLSSALAVALTIASGSADAATLVVDKDGQQCRNAGYQTISAAVSAADRGDQIEVCPDLYTESVVVNTPELKLTATGRLPQDCGDATAAPADPAKQAIVTAPAARAFDLQADDIRLTGFVVQGSRQAVRTGQGFSGHRVEHNLLQQNTLGVLLGGSGERLSRLSHNCIRHNGSGQVGAGVFSSAMLDASELRDGRIDHNTFYANNFAIRLGGGEAIAVDHNRSSVDGVFIRPAFTRTLTVSHNRVGQGASHAIWFFRMPAVPQMNADAVVSHNTIENRGGHAIISDSAALTGSLISHNTLTNNALDGINLQTANTDNRIEHNRAEVNGSDGIHAQGATGNVFVKNRMSANVEHDAHDDNLPANQWTKNRCQTDFPTGSICAR